MGNLMRNFVILLGVLFLFVSGASAARLSVLFGGGGEGLSNQKAYSRLFVTSTTYDGNLGGLAGADAKCQARADAVSLGGTWKALLATSTSDFNARLGSRVKPILDLRGRLLWNPVVPFPGQVAGGDGGGYLQLGYVLTVAPTTTELLTSVSANVWSGWTGGQGAINLCGDWQVTTGNGLVGHSGYTSSGWISYNNSACSTLQRLYCIENE